jgi:hypothetical protein
MFNYQELFDKILGGEKLDEFEREKVDELLEEKLNKEEEALFKKFKEEQDDRLSIDMDTFNNFNEKYHVLSKIYIQYIE